MLNIPARVTADELSRITGRDLREVQAVLQARGQADSPEEILGAELAIAVARALGVEVVVEPRDLALERLYEFETRGELGSDVGGRAGEIVESVISNLDELDEMIESVAERWSVARMPVIDRNVIRIAIQELRTDEETPTAVIISEAVRLAQTYSTEKSAAFVNGVLATLARSIRES